MEKVLVSSVLATSLHGILHLSTLYQKQAWPMINSRLSKLSIPMEGAYFGLKGQLLFYK